MKLPDSFQKHLRAHIDFSSFILLDMVVIDDTKSAVFLVPKMMRLSTATYKSIVKVNSMAHLMR